MLKKQPWNFRGSLAILDVVLGDECPAELNLLSVSFWVQVHDLQLRAMNKEVGEDIEVLIGNVSDVVCDGQEAALGKCLRLRVSIDVSAPFSIGLTSTLGAPPPRSFSDTKN